ncbi:MAG: PilZ domain-containing protein [Candidatus Omnitrophota bacterium]
MYDRRRNPRFECPPQHEYVVELADHSAVAQLSNLSRDGIAFVSSKDFHPEEIYQFLLKGPHVHSAVACEARISWTKALHPSRFSYGAKITKIDPQAKTDILDFLYQDWKEKITASFKPSL